MDDTESSPPAPDPAKESDPALPAAAPAPAEEVKPADWFDEAAAAAQAKVDAPAKTGRDLWKAYRTAAGGKSRLGEPLPQSWDDLTEDRQVVWNLAATAFLA